eukprot:TRINITY_DN57710_c0_g1_i1.p1 TRINITY_DN57710_c0_g1~~TRINITY_DN57710_c0_g1_i1.p1  ORF type:complete len:210 (-),score=30.61 TRINITY_DN57710_c0_g1_i1:82-618(-)
MLPASGTAPGSESRVLSEDTGSQPPWRAFAAVFLAASFLFALRSLPERHVATKQVDGRLALLELEGQCTAEDAALLGDLAPASTSFFRQLRDCARSSLSMLFQWSEQPFETCMTKTHLSEACSSCYGKASQYSLANCKIPCLLSWCSQSCIDCGLNFQPALSTCTGIPLHELPLLKAC